MPNTLAHSLESDILSACRSCMAATSKAFVLLSTTRFRMAFLSPGAGARLLVSWPGLFFLTLKAVFSPRLGLPEAPLLDFGVGFAHTVELVEKEADDGRYRALEKGASNGKLEVYKGIHLQQS